MDKEQAKFILRSFRPDGADACDADFAEALQLAMENRDLGEWLAQERAFDGEFARVLESVDLPGNLREDIMACLAVGRADHPQAEDAFDAALIGAFATIQPPATLRDSVLTAMFRTKGPTPKKISISRRALIPWAIAAGIAMAFFITAPTKPSAVAKVDPVPIDVLQASFANTYESPFFRLEKKSTDPAVLINHLAGKQLPTTDKLIPGLENSGSLGCRELLLEGKRGSLICFELRAGGVIHLVVFRREDVSGELPRADQPQLGERGKWKSARWEGDGKVFMVMTDSKETNLRDFF